MHRTCRVPRLFLCTALFSLAAALGTGTPHAGAQPQGKGTTVVVPINVLLKSHEIAYFLRDSEAKVLVAWDDCAPEAVPLQELLTGFRSGLFTAIVVIFLMLAANFQSLRLSVVVISTLPAVITRKRWS